MTLGGLIEVASGEGLLAGGIVAVTRARAREPMDRQEAKAREGPAGCFDSNSYGGLLRSHHIYLNSL